MKKIDLGQTITILANVGVIAGIVLLAVEINQSRELMRTQIRHEIAQSTIDTILLESTDLETASIVRRGLQGEELSADEEFRFFRILSAEHAHVADVYSQYQGGLLDESEYRVHANFLILRLERPIVRDHWCETNRLFDQNFVESVNSLASIDCRELRDAD